MTKAFSVPAAFFAAIALLTGAARADTISAKGISYDRVQVVTIKDGRIFFRTAAGNEISRPLADIDRLSIDGEPALAAAEDLFRAQKWEQAADAYQRAMRATAKDWLRNYISLRLTETAGKTGRFDLVIDGHIATLLRDPASGKSAQLTFPAPGSPALAAAIGKVKGAYNERLTVPQKTALLELRIALLQHASDASGLEEAVALMAGINPAHPLVKEQETRRLIAGLRSSLAARRFDEAIEAIRKETEKFNTPELQAEALYCYAEAKAGKAAGGPETAWKDVVLDYLRVASSFAAENPRVPEAMLKAAGIIEKQLKDPKGALKLYKRLATEHKAHPAGRQAEQKVAELEPAGR